MGSNTDSSTQSLDFPPMITNNIAGREREREKPAHNRDTKEQSLSDYA
jgi:hypothetical protein